MSFTKKEKPIIYRYSIDNTVLTRPEVIRDLGAITESAFKSLGFVIRNGREFGDIETLKLLYFTYCRSCLEYASVIWSPVYNIHISSLERIQRRFLKTVSYIVDGVYPLRGYPQDLLLGRFKIPSLLNRRREHSSKFSTCSNGG
ncbi:uncharacterized protein LOC135131821 [Zophobas morio]|uniref:uncharacterized protein LOC135131821 n=1 Tax=Zophobas morio TaxID=2755281 RepID=UPI003082E8CA